jgi:hypothetical protein
MQTVVVDPPSPLKFWKTMEIGADLSENRLNSGNFITILSHKNSGKLSTPPSPPESICHVRL